MNKVVLMGRLTQDPKVFRKANSCVAKFTLAADRRFAKADDEVKADFINCTAFGKSAEFAEKYFTKGIKICVTGRLQSSSYIDNETGKKVFGMDVIVEEQEFCESKKANSGNGESFRPQNMGADSSGWINVADGVEDEGLPFN